MTENVVRVSRGSEVESVHRLQAVAIGLPGEREIRFGDTDVRTFWRSAMKPFQALPVIEDAAAARFGFGPRELALCAASHGGASPHVRGVQGMLERLGLDGERLACGPQRPFDRKTAEELIRDGRSPTRLHNNCSGKHAGMLAVTCRHEWPTAGYETYDHPVQRRLRAALRPWIDRDPESLPWATDGCGVPTPFVSLREMAVGYVRLMREAAEDSPARAVVGAMTAFPELTSSEGRVPLTLMRATGGRLLAKEGAEGVLCVASPADGWALALKVVDGGLRATGPAAMEILCTLGVLDEKEKEALAALRRTSVRNTLGVEVGAIVARVRPEPRSPVVSGDVVGAGGDVVGGGGDA